MKKLTIIIFFLTYLEVFAQVPIKREIAPVEWLFVGPLPSSSDPFLEPILAGLSPQEGSELTTLYDKAGITRWRKLTAKEPGVVEFTLDLRALEGPATLYACTRINTEHDQVAIASLEGALRFYINDRAYIADVYSHDYFLQPVYLEKGENLITVKVSAWQRGFRFRLIPPESPLMLNLKDTTLPDLVEKELLDSWGSVMVMNLTNKIIKDAKIICGDSEIISKEISDVPILAPYGLMRVPFKIKQVKEIEGKESIELPLELNERNHKYSSTIVLNIRKKEQHRKITFISRLDGSVQYYGVVPPKDYDPKKKYAVFLSLHGANVIAFNQAGAYIAKDWGIIVAPTNRHRYGFNWEDWGRIDALEVLDHVKTIFPVDESRLYLTGHSMGGHGVWHVGMLHPDIFAAMGPSAGWINKKLYASFDEANLAGSRLQEIFGKCSRLSLTLPFLKNIKHLPLFIIHGEKDDNVPVSQSRLMNYQLKNIGHDNFHYYEAEGQKHWWDDPDTKGIDCVDLEGLFDFLKKYTRVIPEKFTFITPNPGATSRCYGFEIIQQEHILDDSKLTVDRNKVQTDNVAMLKLEGVSNINIDGQDITLNNAPAILKKESAEWVVLNGEPGLIKIPSLYGPFKQVFMNQFLFVYGTRGDEKEDKICLQKALFDARVWAWIANGLVNVIPDTLFDDRYFQDYNVILYGNSTINLVTRKLHDNFPIKIENGKITYHDKVISKEGIACMCIYPYNKRLVAVIAGTDYEGMKMTQTVNIFSSYVNLPDFIIWEKEALTQGLAGVLVAGFFDNTWKFSPALTFEKR